MAFFGKLRRLLEKNERRSAADKFKAKPTIEQLEDRCVMANVNPFNQAPTISVIADQVLPRSRDFLLMHVNAQDANGDALSYQAVIGDPLAAADQYFQFRKAGSYYDNIRGAGERYVYSDARNAWFVLFPNGELRQFNNTLADSPLVLNVGSNVWANPALLHDPVVTVPKGVVSGDAEAYALDQRLGLRMEAAGYYQNVRGANEKWMMAGKTGQWHYILSSGQVHAWNGSLVTSPFVASFDTRFYDAPALLHEAEAVVSRPVTVRIGPLGNLVVDPPPGYSGSFDVTVLVSDGQAVATRTFRVTVPNTAPNIPNLADQSVRQGGDLAVNLPTRDSDGDLLNYKIVISGDDRAYALDQQLGLMKKGSYYENQRGASEKYIWSAVRGSWYFILPSGALHQWNGSINTSPQAAMLDAGYYANPALLHDAVPPSYPAASGVLVMASFSNGVLSINTPDGYTGTFAVSVTGSDGLLTTTRKFYVSAINNAPVIAPISTQTVVTGSPVQVNLGAFDPDGDPLTLSVQISGDRQAYDLDQQLQLRFTGSYYENTRGAGEKYIFSGARNQWYFILPNGELHAWSGSIAGSPLAATLDPVYYQSPTLLHDAQPPGAVGVTGQISGDVLTLTPVGSYVGAFQATVTASDGRIQTKRTFMGRVVGTPSITLNQTLQLGAPLWGTISGGLLRASSAGNTAGELVYTVSAAPARGTLVLNGNILGAGGTFTQDDVDKLRLNYYHNGSESTGDSFTFTVRNSAGVSSPATEFRIVKPANTSINTQTEVSAFVSSGNALGVIGQALQTPAGQILAGLIDLNASSVIRDSSSRLAKLQLRPGANPILAVQKLQQVPGVQWAVPNNIYKNPLDFIPPDPRFPQQYHHRLMQNPQAWDFSRGDPFDRVPASSPPPATRAQVNDLIVAVIDTGVAWNHPDLAANIWRNPDEDLDFAPSPPAPPNTPAPSDDDGNGFPDDVRGWDFVDNDNDPNPGTLTASEGHGTHVAGIIGAKFNTVGVAGTAGETTIMPIRAGTDFGGFTSLDIAFSYLYAIDNGARIINLSVSTDGLVNDPNYRFVTFLAHGAGILCINSAGNNGQLNPRRQQMEELVFVAATDQLDSRAVFSNLGTGIDIAAPGVDIISTLPADTYGPESGTSMSAPNAAGTAALIWSEFPFWTRDQVAAQLFGTADNIDASNPLEIGLLGRGRVNSFRAVTGSPPAPTVDPVGLPTSATNFATPTPITAFSLKVPQLLDTATVKIFNFELRGDGPDNIFGTSDDVVAPLQNPPAGNNLRLNFDPNWDGYLVGTNSIPFVVSGMTPDTYRFRARSGGLRNPFSPTDPDPTVRARAKSLDGNSDGTPGDDFVFTFVVGAGGVLPGPGTGTRVAAENPRNDTDDTATDLGVLTSAITSLQAIRRHSTGEVDYDWFSSVMSRSGQLTVSLNNIVAGGGDIHFRIYRLANNVLNEIGSATATGGRTTQTTTVSVVGGERIFVWVYGFNFAQGDYDLSLTLA